MPSSIHRKRTTSEGYATLPMGFALTMAKHHRLFRQARPPSRLVKIKKAMAEMKTTLEEMRTQLSEKQVAIELRPRNSILVLQAMIERVERAFQDFNREASKLGYAPQAGYVYGSLRRQANKTSPKKISRLLVETRKLLMSSLQDRV